MDTPVTSHPASSGLPSGSGKQVVTRFAPSPTGYLHIGGARTALFNFLFARHHGGVFRLRIEDTDRARSVPAAIEAILEGLGWLGLTWDGGVIYQFSRKDRHAEIAHQLVASGKAYFCYASAEELDAMREAARAAGKPLLYDGRWRDSSPSEAPAGVKPAIRLKTGKTGETVIDDLVQGRVVVANTELDDMVLLRSDGTATYMLAVVVDDHDMGVTHVIRGDDHLNNAFRQLQLIRALDWPEPAYAHIPLIHGEDGHKLSKRQGAVGLQEFRDMGLLPQAVENYLLRLGWSHGDDEIISRAQAIDWFDLDAVGRSPSRLDAKKLENLNGHYLRELPVDEVRRAVLPFLEQDIGRALVATEQNTLTVALPELTQRAKTLRDLATTSRFLFVSRPLVIDAAAEKALATVDTLLIESVVADLDAATDWSATSLDALLKAAATRANIGLGKLLPPMRAALTGTTQAPGVAVVLSWLGRDESLARLYDEFTNNQNRDERAVG
jgi:glutamyl-tRNA synthetase